MGQTRRRHVSFKFTAPSPLGAPQHKRTDSVALQVHLMCTWNCHASEQEAYSMGSPSGATSTAWWYFAPKRSASARMGDHGRVVCGTPGRAKRVQYRHVSTTECEG
jgi:hypothetical protein